MGVLDVGLEAVGYGRYNVYNPSWSVYIVYNDLLKCGNAKLPHMSS